MCHMFKWLQAILLAGSGHGSGCSEQNGVHSNGIYIPGAKL